MSTSNPSEHTACEIACRELGWTNVSARRFTTGTAFFVYEVTSNNEQAVVRIGRPHQSDTIRQGLELMGKLEPLGVPLLKIWGSGEHAGFPYVIMSRLAGTDLGHVLIVLTSHQLGQVAKAVADAQAATSRSERGKGFGYSVTAGAAPYSRWTDVVRAHIERSRRRIVESGLFPIAIVDPVHRLLSGIEPRLDVMAPAPFLHDTTTKNVIVSAEGRLLGIVDVDDLCFGDVRYPAALTAAALLNSGNTTDYVEAWLAHADQVWDGVFDFYIATFLLDFASEHGMSFNGNEVSSRSQDRDRLAQLYADAVSRAESSLD